MGLDCSHDAFSGGYSAFNRLRQFVAAAAGGSFPPHWVVGEDGEFEVDEDTGLIKRDESLDGDLIYFSEEHSTEKYPGLKEFLGHSDCDGEISAEMCTVVADDLKALIPQMKKMKWPAVGHIARGGGYLAMVKKFIAGCREAAAAKQPLTFG